MTTKQKAQAGLPPIDCALIQTNNFRCKPGGRLQRAHTYRPWVSGYGDPTRVRWIDVPMVSDETPDDEEWNG